MANLKITLVKSTIGALKDQQATVKALGLRKPSSEYGFFSLKKDMKEIEQNKYIAIEG